MNNELDCIIRQLKQEIETRQFLSDTNLCQGRIDQIVEKRKSEIRRRCDQSMNDDVKI
jgi:hypothetical protein